MSKKKVVEPEKPKQLAEVATEVRNLLFTKEKLSAREVIIVLELIKTDATLVLLLTQLARTPSSATETKKE